MSYVLLADAMRFSKTVEIEGRRGIVRGIQAEDGSGKCWLVKLHNHDEWIFVRTD